MKGLKKTLQGFLLLSLIGILIGMIFLIVPTFEIVLINYIGAPLLQLIILIMLAIKFGNKK